MGGGWISISRAESANCDHCKTRATPAYCCRVTRGLDLRVHARLDRRVKPGDGAIGDTKPIGNGSGASFSRRNVARDTPILMDGYF
jgi:hypothetical protein